MCSSVQCGTLSVVNTTRLHRLEQVRHKETNCTRTHRNEAKQTEDAVEQTGANRSGGKRTGIPPPISGPRYRGSNPCLPANLTLTHTATYTNEKKFPNPRGREPPAISTTSPDSVSYQGDADGIFQDPETQLRQIDHPT